MSLVWHNAQIKWKLFKQAFIKKFWFLCVQNTPFFTHRSEKKQQLNNFLIKTYKQVMLSLIYGASIEEELKLNGKKKEIIRTWFLLGSFKTRSFLNYGILFFFFFCSLYRSESCSLEIRSQELFQPFNICMIYFIFIN